MENQIKYYLLKKNNNLQTNVSLISPYILVSNDKNETLAVKQSLEIKYLRNIPIDNHFDHTEIVCDKEIIDFDKFLLEHYDFSFLSDDFDHTQDELNGKILYGKKFPQNLSDTELLKIQEKMNKYHFDLIEQVPNGKSIIILNPWDLDNPLRDSELFQLTECFDSKTSAKQFIENIIEEQFDSGGTYMTVGHIQEEDLTNKTKKILNSQSDIMYKSKNEDYGQQFVSRKRIGEIENGMEILLDLLESVGKKPYDIIELDQNLKLTMYIGNGGDRVGSNTSAFKKLLNKLKGN